MSGIAVTYTNALLLFGAVILTVGLYVACTETLRGVVGIDLPTAIRFRFGLALSGLPFLAVLERERILEALGGPDWQTIVLGCLGSAFVSGVTLVGLMLFRFGESG